MFCHNICQSYNPTAKCLFFALQLKLVFFCKWLLRCYHVFSALLLYEKKMVEYSTKSTKYLSLKFYL